jgi:membrane-bound transcription factor site-1 protease
MAPEKRPLAYAAALPLVLLALRVLLLPSDDSPSGRETLDAPAARYVVRFREYRPAEDHRGYLEDRLRGAASPPAGSWRWVERRNPAAAYPTDFAVLEIRDARREDVLAALRALGRVRDVHADASHSRGVLSVDRSPQGRGKRFTAMSFECQEEGVGGDNGGISSQNSSSSSGSWRRKLQMQVHFSWRSWWKHLCVILFFFFQNVKWTFRHESPQLLVLILHI